MAGQITRTNTVLISDNLTTTSQIVAEKFGKEHSKVMRSIEAMNLPQAYRNANFGETVTERPNPAGGAPIKSKSYTLTRDGFAILVMGFTGKRAMAWKIRFLEAFNAMAHQTQLDNTHGRQGYEDGLRAMLRHKSPEELAAWAQGDRSKIDKVIDYLDATLLDPGLDAEARRELRRVRAIARTLRGDTPDTRLIPVKAHLRKANPR